jgi:hypothetical protein
MVPPKCVHISRSFGGAYFRPALQDERQLVLPFAVTERDFPFGYIIGSGGDYHNHGHKTEHAEHGNGDIVSGEERPGLHGVVSNCKYYSAFLTKGKVRLTGQESKL